MPNNLKDKPVGKDVNLQSLQVRLYDKLTAKWGIELQGYGRAYVNEKDGKMIPEFFVKKPKTYSGTLLTSDKSKFFFIDSGSAKPIGQTLKQTDLDICFIVDLGKAYPDIAHRADSEVAADVELLLKDASDLNITIKDGPVTGIKNVFKGLDFKYTDDMQPKHAFKFTITMLYSITQTEC